MSKFGLVKSFQIDNGELDGHSAQEIFVLGYELAQIDQLLKEAVSVQLPVHAGNRDRIIAACVDAGREYQLTWLPDDISESWLLLKLV